MRFSSRRHQRGNAVIEASLLIPWILFLFMGVLDFGFYNYALITTENAARVGAHYASQDKGRARDVTEVCRIVRQEMSGLPHTRSLSGCAACSASLTEAMPLSVCSQLLEAPGRVGPAGDTAAEVTVSYRTVPLIPLPFLTGQLTITRVKQMSINVY